jgi:hypothetical protein
MSNEKVVRIRMEMSTEEAEVKLKSVRMETAAVNAEVDKVAVKSRWTATKIVATLFLVQSFLMTFLEGVFGSISHVSRAVLMQGFQAAQLYVYMGMGATTAGQPHLAAALFVASASIAVQTAHLQDIGERQITAELNAAKSKLYALSSYARLYM